MQAMFLLFAMLFALFLLFGCGTQHDAISNYKSATSHIWIVTHDGAKADPCFIENYGAVADEINRRTWEVCHLIKVPHPTVEVHLMPIITQAMGYAANYSQMFISANTRQLAVFAHELTRFSCLYSNGCCAWDHSSRDWSGAMGVLWNHAETEAVKRCG